MLNMRDMKRIQNNFETLTGRKIGFSNNRKSNEWIIFEIKEDC